MYNLSYSGCPLARPRVVEVKKLQQQLELTTGHHFPEVIILKWPAVAPVTPVGKKIIHSIIVVEVKKLQQQLESTTGHHFPEVIILKWPAVAPVTPVGNKIIHSITIIIIFLL